MSSDDEDVVMAAGMAILDQTQIDPFEIPGNVGCYTPPNTRTRNHFTPTLTTFGGIYLYLWIAYDTYSHQLF